MAKCKERPGYSNANREGMQYLCKRHPLVGACASFVIDFALAKKGNLANKYALELCQKTNLHGKAIH